MMRVKEKKTKKNLKLFADFHKLIQLQKLYTKTKKQHEGEATPQLLKLIIFLKNLKLELYLLFFKCVFLYFILYFF